MSMGHLVEALKNRQGDRRTEEFAVEMGISSSALFAYFRDHNGRTIGIDNARKMAAYFNENGDKEMIDLIAAYVLNLDVSPQ